MKQLLPFLAFILSVCNSQAQRLIALEHGSITTFHSYLDSAMYFAANGDNIYLPGGTIQFSSGVTSFIVDKAVHIYGSGYNPDSTSVLGISQLPSFTYVLNSASGGSFEGLQGATIKTGNSPSNSDVNGFTFRRCKIGDLSLSNSVGWLPCSNINVAECILTQLQSQNNPQSVLIEKCFIGNSQSPNIVSATTWTGVVFRNNVFYGRGFGGGSYMMSIFSNCIFENNVIHNFTNVQQWDITGSIVRNNLFTCQQSVAEVGSGNTFTNNFYSQSLSSIFQNSTSTTYSFADNYHLANSCIGINAGTDATDIGIYGTSSPFKEGGIPVNPHIFYKNISSQTDGSGNLQINVKVKAQDN